MSQPVRAVAYYRMSTDQFWQTSPSAYPTEQMRSASQLIRSVVHAAGVSSLRQLSCVPPF